MAGFNQAVAFSSWLAAVFVALVPAVVAADLGGVLPWTQWLISVIAAVALVLVIPSLIAPGRVASRQAMSVTLFLICVAVLGSLQSVPLPSNLWATFAPGSAESYQSAFDAIAPRTIQSGETLHPKRGLTLAVPPTGQAPLGTHSPAYFPLTVSRWLTINAAASMVVLAAFSLVSSQWYVTRGRVAVLLVVIALTGAVHAGFGFYQTMNDPTATVWGYKSEYGGAPFGAFVNRSNAAVMMNVGLAAGLGLVAWRLAAITGSTLNGDAIPVSQWRDVLFDRVVMFAVTCSLLSAGGLFACGSRGGLVGMLAGLLLAFGVVQSLHRGRGILPTLLAIGLMAAVLLIKFDLPATSLDRLNATPDQVMTEDGFQDGRWEHWKDGWRAAMAQPLLGWGLGAYRFAYLPYQQTSSGSWFVNADNLWLEWFVETGLLGVVIAMVLVVIVVRALGCLNASADPIDHGLATAGWFTLGSLAASQCFDFGLRIPANAILVAILASAIVARSSVIGYFGKGKKRVRYHLCKAPEGPVPGKWYLTLFSRPVPGKWYLTFFSRPEGPVPGKWYLTLFSRLPLKLPPEQAWLPVAAVLVGAMILPAIVQLDASARGDYLQRVARLLPNQESYNAALASEIETKLASHLDRNPSDFIGSLERSRLTVDIARYRAAYAATRGSEAADQMASFRALAPSRLRGVWYADVRALSPSAEVGSEQDRDKTNVLIDPTQVKPIRGAEASLASVSPLFPIAEKRDSPDSVSTSNPLAISDSDSDADSDADAKRQQQRIEFGFALHRGRSFAVDALRACPLSDAAHQAIVKLDFAGGSPQQTEMLLSSMLQLRNRYAPSLLFTGQLAAEAGLWEVAAESFSRAMQRDPAVTSAIMAVYPQASPISLASLLPSDPRVLAIAATHELQKPKPDISILARAIEVLNRVKPSDVVAQVQQLRLLAEIHDKRDQPKLAAQSLSQAVALMPADMDTRYRYAVSLRESGETAMARQQARAGQKIAPQDLRFEQLLVSLGE